jgi:homoserine dehydrogenase
MHKHLNLGLFGFGCVGYGLYEVLQQTPTLKASIKRICVKDKNKARQIGAEHFTFDKDEILEDAEINTIVELIDDADAAYEIVKAALQKGKAVVTANKKMIAEHFEELLHLQRQYNVPLLYEAACCASIPIIRNLEEYYDNDLLHSIRAIVNGSTNFILTKMFEDRLDFSDALLLAQQLGFAETDPKLDVEGWDALHKWIILLNHAYGIVETAENILFSGIQNIQLSDAVIAKEKNNDIKLIAQARKLANGKVAAFVLPQFVQTSDPLAFVKNEYNGVVIESGFADKQFFYGKGAGSFPTASAVLSDISALRYQYRYEYKKKYYHPPHELTDDYYIKVYLSFNDWKQIPREKFEWIEEWHANSDRKYLVGVIHQQHLKTGNWWKEDAISLIVMPDPIIDNLDIIQLKKKSLELAGIQ